MKRTPSNTCSICGNWKQGASKSNGLAPCYSCISKLRGYDKPVQITRQRSRGLFSDFDTAWKCKKNDPIL